jgi:hypothetical protein
MKLHGKKNWNSLTDLKNYIRDHVKDEKVITFDGFELTTNKNCYRMDPDGVKVRPLPK